MDQNVKLTSEYLNNLTDDLRFDKMIDEIIYVDKTEPVKTGPYSMKDLNDELIYRIFYYLNFKCFEIELKTKINEEDSYYLWNRRKLIVKFRSNFVKKSKWHPLLLFASNGSKEFTNPIECKLVSDIKLDNQYFEIFWNKLRLRLKISLNS